MDVSISEISWLAVIAAIIAGQVLLTLWFTLLFGTPWAKAYGAENRSAHSKDVPGSAYGVGVICMIALVFATALLHQAIGIDGIGDGFVFGLIASIGYGLATVLPGYGFLLKSDAGLIAAGSQAAAILLVSVVLSALG